MSVTDQPAVTPVPARIDNVADWEAFANQISLGTGLPSVVSPEMIIGMAGSAVPLLFGADAAQKFDLLRGTFSDAVVAQCARNAGTLMGAQPESVAIHLAGSRVVDGHLVVRAHLVIAARDPCGNPTRCQQFWDLQFGAQVIVNQPACPNCGAPVGTGELICRHCHADVRRVADVPIVVSRLELY